LIREALGATTPDDAIEAVTLDPVTGRLLIEWNATYVTIGDISVNPATGSLYSQLGFTDTTHRMGGSEGVESW
jgi:hypothetical protein